MRRRGALIKLFAAVLLATVITHQASGIGLAQEYLTEDEVERAIAAGKRLGSSKEVLKDQSLIYKHLNIDKHYDLYIYDFNFYFLGPIQMLTKEVALAQRKAIKTFSDFDLSEEDIKRFSRKVVTVEAWSPTPQIGAGYITYQYHALDIVLVVNHDLDNPIRPIDKTIIPHVFTNAFGFEVTSSSVIGYFAMEEFPFDARLFSLYVIYKGDSLEYEFKKKRLNIR